MLQERRFARGLVIATAVFGVAMTVAMGLAYTAFLGEPAWASMATLPFFVLGDLSMGAGLYLAFNRDALSVKAFKGYFIAAQVLAAVSIVALAVHFAGVGASVLGIIAGCIVGPAASCIAAFLGGKPDKTGMATAACVLAIAGMVIAHYAFYAASII